VIPDRGTKPVLPGRHEERFDCTERRHGAWLILALAGALDVVGSDAVRKALIGLQLTRHGRLALDLSRVSFMDSAGVRLILQAMDLADRHGADFALIRGPAAVERVLGLVGLSEQVRTVDHPLELDRLATGNRGDIVNGPHAASTEPPDGSARVGHVRPDSPNAAAGASATSCRRLATSPRAK
jgi:anti-sigma B factor antagonist